jgi:hypothetical protein
LLKAVALLRIFWLTGWVAICEASRYFYVKKPGGAMATIATKFQTGTAALAIAAAATLIPVAAQAAPSMSAPTAPVTQVLHELNLGPAFVPEVTLWWLGNTNPNPNPNRLSLPFIQVPILSQILVAVGLANTELCLGGPGVRIGQYGGISVSLGLGC